MTLERRVRDIERRIERLVQVGTVVEVDYPAMRVKLRIGDRVSGWLRFTTHRAGADRTWWPPTIGEQTMVFAPNGDAVAAVVGNSLYQEDYTAPATEGSIQRTVMEDGSCITYDRVNRKLTINLVGTTEIAIAGDATITVGGTAKLDAPLITLNGGTGCITQESVCHFTGRPHGDGSSTVLAGK